MHRHQAPTLIDCKFLKNISLDPEACFTPFTAPLRLQQRSEIIYRFFTFVNSYLLALFSANPANPYLHWLPAPHTQSLRFAPHCKGDES